MDIVSAEHFLLDQIPNHYRAIIPPTLKMAYDAARLLIKGEPILQTRSAIPNHGRIISYAVDSAFIKLIDSGRWPVEYRWRPYAEPTGEYLEIRLSHSGLTISNVRDARKQPRNVEFRKNGRLSNRPFLDLPEFEDENRVEGLPSLLLVHGYQDLGFAHLGVPNKIHRFGYIYQTPNLLLLPHEVTPDTPPPEQTDIDATMSLKEEIEKWRKDHGDD